MNPFRPLPDCLNRPEGSRTTMTISQVDAPADLVASVRRAWAEALGHDEFSDDENFHRVGGHSGAALRISKILKTELGRPVPIRLLFTNLTVGEQATALAVAPQAAEARA